MKRIALLGAAAAGMLIAVPANAQYSRHGSSYGHSYGHDYRHHDYGHSYHGSDGYRGYDRYHGYGYGGYSSRPRVECRIERRYYGPVRRCFTVWR